MLSYTSGEDTAAPSMNDSVADMGIHLATLRYGQEICAAAVTVPRPRI